ncbi:MAG: glutamate 5-kinase [Deltaproteobacteria bacterium]|nr:glutamate 5-kinase [Deltaproteobacteria bacterium]
MNKQTGLSEQRKALVKRVKKIVIKIGSAVLTDNGVLHRPTITRLADDIATLKKKGYQTVIVSSGAIASGVGKMGLRRKPVTIPQKQAVAAIGQGSLMYAYEEAFNAHQMLVAQILLTREDLTNRQRYLNARNTLITLLEWGIIPIINENDTVAVEEIKFGDNDNLSALIAHLIESDLLIVLTDTEGLYERDPREDPQARLIPVVEQVNSQVLEYTSNYSGQWGLGGMRSKIMAARKVTAGGISVIVASGRKEGVLQEIIKGKPVGTLFLPQKATLSRKKHWIAFTLKHKGDIIIDEGAKQAVLEKGKSLLPSGVVGVQGRFSMGACVRLVDQKARLIGKGLANYSSSDILKICGMKSSEIEKKLEFKHSDEVIHRDNMVITNE